ncbi:iron complex outermembrane recepter protein [Sphingobium faniae]|nr:iron complex outermembrane recepter protein [Sphingobium faniae]
MNYVRKAAVASAGCLLCLGANAQAQVDENPVSAASPSKAQIEEIVVTAQRRSEKLQDVPIAINALTANSLVSRGLTSPQELASVVPGLQFGSLGPSGTPFIRGVGGVLGNPNDEPSVATYVDGVYIASPLSNYSQFANIERIEVLKGPQGTLFGRNATGGVIQIITRDPSRTPELAMTVGYANYDTVSGSVYANTPLTDTLAFNVAAQIDSQGKGYGHDVLTGRETYKKDERSIRGKLLFEPDDATTIKLAADYASFKSAGLGFSPPRGATFLDGVVNTLPVYDTRSGTDEVIDIKNYGVSATVYHDFGPLRVNSITAYRKSTGVDFFDNDMTTLNIVEARLNLRQKNFSQEIHLLSPTSSTIDWLLGGYYYNGQGGYAPISIFIGGPPSVNIFGKMHTRSYSIFGQATVEILPETHLTGGLRYTWEKQRLVQEFVSGAGPIIVPRTEARQSFGKPTWRLALDHKFTSDVMAYASYNRGIKSGGYDTVASPGIPGFKPETLDAYEVGLKTELFDRHVRFNAAGFWYKYKNLQLSHQVNGTSITSNAAKARIRGIEGELQIATGGGLQLSFTGGYTDGQYTDFPDAPAYTAGGTLSVIDASGNRTIRTPKFTGSTSINYTVPTDIGEFSANANMSFTGKFFWTPDNRLAQQDYGLLNATLQWTSRSERFSARIWGKNLTKKQYVTSGVESTAGDLLIYGAPRTYGLTLGMKM